MSNKTAPSQEAAHPTPAKGGNEAAKHIKGAADRDSGKTHASGEQDGRAKDAPKPRKS